VSSLSDSSFAHLLFCPKQKPDCCGDASHGNPVPVGLPYIFGNPAVSFFQETRGFPSPPHDGFGFIDFPYYLYLTEEIARTVPAVLSFPNHLILGQNSKVPSQG